MATKNKNLTYDIKDLKSKYNSYLSDVSSDDSLENFIEFLKTQKIKTINAQRLYNQVIGRTNKLHIDRELFKMRKEHPHRDFIIKKVAIPLAITAVSVGVSYNAIMHSGMVGGSQVLGFIPVSGTPGFTGSVLGSTGLLAGALGTTGIIGGKNLITRTYYKIRDRKSIKGTRADKNLEAYNFSSIENTPSNELIKLIQEKQHIIYSSGKPKGLIMSIVNRNRIHEIQALTLELATRYNKIDKYPDNKVRSLFNNYKEIVKSDATDDIKNARIKTLLRHHEFAELVRLCPIDMSEFLTENIDTDPNTVDMKLKDTALTPIYALLENVENFILSDIAEGKTNALIRAKRKNQKQLVENADIYAKLKIAYERILKINEERSNEKFLMSDAKSKIRRVRDVKEEAYNLVENETKFITSPLRKPVYSTPISEEADGDTYDEDPVDEVLVDEVLVDEVPVYEDLVDEVNEDITFTSPIKGPLNCAETKLKNKAGKDIGSRLHFSNGIDYFEVEVRYMATKKNIRIKLITDVAETAKFITINDTIIPPINQIKRIIERIKSDLNATEIANPDIFDLAEEFTFPSDDV